MTTQICSSKFLLLGLNVFVFLWQVHVACLYRSSDYDTYSISVNFCIFTHSLFIHRFNVCALSTIASWTPHFHVVSVGLHVFGYQCGACVTGVVSQRMLKLIIVQFIVNLTRGRTFRSHTCAILYQSPKLTL